MSNSEFIEKITSSSIERIVRRELEVKNSEILSRYEDLNLRYEIMYFIDIAAKLDNKMSFTNTEKDEALLILRRLAIKKGVQDNAQFISALTNIVISFYRADLKHEVSEIERLFQPLLLSDQKCVFCLVQHYSLLVFGDAEPDDEDIHRLKQYIEACEKIKRNDIVIIHSILLSCRFSINWIDSVRMYIDDAMSLEAPQRDSVFKTIKRNCDPKNLAIKPYARHERIAALHQKVVDEFKIEFEPWDNSELKSDEDH